MSTSPDIPPEEAMRAIADRQRRRQALKAIAVGGSPWRLIGALLVVSIRDDPPTGTDSVPPGEGWLTGLMAGTEAIWVALGEGGVALIDPDTLGVTVIPVDAIGHEALGVALDGDVAYVASGNRVTSIVDGDVRATTSTGWDIRYLGSVEGVFGALSWQTFVVLKADDPMEVDFRRVSTEGGWVAGIDGETWTETRNDSLRRVELVPVSAGDG